MCKQAVFLLLFVFMGLATVCVDTGLGASLAKNPSEATNTDWLLMSQEEKAYCLVSLMKAMNNHGIPFGKSPQEYAAMIDSVVDSPKLKPNKVQNILLSIVYADEPQARAAIDVFQKK